jgi:hypothetical protein
VSKTVYLTRIAAVETQLDMQESEDREVKGWSAFWLARGSGSQPHGKGEIAICGVLDLDLLTTNTTCFPCNSVDEESCLVSCLHVYLRVGSHLAHKIYEWSLSHQTEANKYFNRRKCRVSLANRNVSFVPALAGKGNSFAKLGNDGMIYHCRDPATVSNRSATIFLRCKQISVLGCLWRMQPRDSPDHP